MPSETPEPTATKTLSPTETNTPIPSDTPTSTPVPEPVLYEGSGDNIVDLRDIWTSSFGDAAFIQIIGPSTYDNFIVYSYDMAGEKDDLLVNEIGYFEGYLLQLYPISRLEITAGGPWEVKVFPFAKEYAHYLDVPGTYQGNGYDVIVLRGTPDLATFVTASNDNFIVYSISSDGDMDLLVNEIGPYTGTKILSSNTFVLEVKASGDWRVEITE